MPRVDLWAHSQGALRTGKGFHLTLGHTSLEKLMLSHKQLVGSSRRERDCNCSSHTLPSPDSNNAIQHSRVKRDNRLQCYSANVGGKGRRHITKITAVAA